MFPCKKEPEIADQFSSKNLMVPPLKIIQIGDGQYRFKAYVAVTDGPTLIGFRQPCGKTGNVAKKVQLERPSLVS